MMTVAGYANSLQPVLKDFFVDEYAQHPTQIDRLFRIFKSTMNYEEFCGSSDIDNFEQWNGSVAGGDKQETYKITIPAKRWTKSFGIGPDLYEDAKYPVMESKSRELAIAAKRTRETEAFNIFNHAFDTTYASANDEALCSNSHASPVAGVATQDNLTTNALTNDNLISARVAMRKTKSYGGNAISIIPNTLLVGLDKEQIALEITESALRNGEISNTHNVLGKNGQWKFSVLCSPFLTSTTDWFLIDTTYSKIHLQFVNRKPLRTWTTHDDNTLVISYCGEMRFNVGTTDWKWVYGSNASS